MTAGPTRDHIRDAYAKLAHATEGYLLATARRLTNGNLDWAKDLVQDALISGYTAYREGSFREGTNAKAWLSRILTNRFINEYKRKTKWETELETHNEPTTQSPEAELLTDQLDEPLQRALQALPEPQRLCVILIDVEGLEYADAAKLLEVPVGTVRSRLARARLQLYALLTPYAKERRIIE